MKKKKYMCPFSNLHILCYENALFLSFIYILSTLGYKSFAQDYEDPINGQYDQVIYVSDGRFEYPYFTFSDQWGEYSNSRLFGQ